MKRVALVAMSLGLAALPIDAQALEGESSFTPSSFVMPIYSIMLARGLTTNIAIYNCREPLTPTAPPNADAGPPPGPPLAPDAGAGDCLVDMADEAALANLFSAPADIPPGTYDTIVVGTCESSSAGFDAKVKGSVDLEGVTHYTTSGFPVVSTDAADHDYATIHYAGCGGTVKLSPALTVEPGDSITVNAFFTLENLSWVLGNLSTGLGGCAVAPAGQFSVCSGLPVLVGYIGTAAPTLDAFYITEDVNDLLGEKSAGQVLLLSSGGEPFSGFLRRVYSHDSPEFHSGSYDVPLREISKNSSDPADAGLIASDAATPFDAGTATTYDVFAIGDPAEDATKYRMRFPRFELSNHTGRFLTTNGADQVQYRAVKR
jgi:hypothetical protein